MSEEEQFEQVPTTMQAEDMVSAEGVVAREEMSQSMEPSSGSGSGYEGMNHSQMLNLCITHFLSTWNVRAYEFAAIIFTAAAYPDTLVASSIRGMVRSFASICLSSAVGRWIDHSPDRLKTLSITISVNRISVITASVLWFFIVDPLHGGDSHGAVRLHEPDVSGLLEGSLVKEVVFAVILALGILESLSASGNMLSMERDWVVTASAPDGRPYDLTHLNSVMRRIDLICKLVAPIVISTIVSATSIKTGVLFVGAMSAASWGVELWCAKTVWDFNPRLREPKIVTSHSVNTQEMVLPGVEHGRSILTRASQWLRRHARDYKIYFSSVVWVPSLALALLHISALTYNATFITYLLAAGFSLELITIARAAGSLVEVSSTIVTPLGMQYLSKAKIHGPYEGQNTESEESTTAMLEMSQEGEVEEDFKTETGLERLGLWGISWQLLNLVPVVLALWTLSSGNQSTSTSLPSVVSRILSSMKSQPMLSFTVFFFLSLSRLGLWIYDLTTQQLTQTMTLPTQRSSFTGVEYSFVALFELAQQVMAITFHRPQEFKWIALISWIAVATSAVAYAGWVRKMRGHLVHWELIGKNCECVGLRLGHERRGTGWSSRRRLDNLSLGQGG